MQRTARNHGLWAVPFLLFCVSAGSAQTPAPTTCPTSAASFRLTADTTAQALSQLVLKTDVDTTYTIAITERQWERPGLSAGLDIGAAGDNWIVCGGVSVLTGRVRVHLLNVRGRIHHRVSLTEFRSQIGRGK